MTFVVAVLDFSVFLTPSPEAGANYLTYLLGGALWTVILSALSWVIAFVIGSVVGVLRTLPSSILSKIGAWYVEIFRNIPLLVQLFIWFNVVPELVPGFVWDYLRRQESPNRSVLACSPSERANSVPDWPWA